MRIATIPFLNAAPFYQDLPNAFRSAHQFLTDSPRDLGVKAREGLIDAGLLSLVDLWSLRDEGLFEEIGDLGVAGKGPIGSILLFGVKDPSTLEGASIAVSGQTSTSVRLMALWLKEKIGIRQWQPVALGDEADAALLIGDQALARRLSTSSSDPAPIDLCQCWTEWTGLPFVFARWAVRSTLPRAQRGWLLEAVEASLAAAEANWGLLAARMAPVGGFPTQMVERYLRGIRYRLGAEEQAGMDEFEKRLRAAGL